MPISASNLAGNIKDNIVGYFGAGADNTNIENLAQAIADAVILELQSAIVNSTGSSVSGGAVTTTGTIS